MGRQIVHVLQVDPDLARDVDPGSRERAARRSGARAARVDAGRWEPAAEAPSEPGALGLLLLEGLVLRRVVLAGRAGTEILGPGDLIRPFDCHEMFAMVPSEVTWRVEEEAQIAVLDERFQQQMSAYPEVVSQLMARIAARGSALAQRVAIIQQPRLTARLHFTLWQLADRFGRVDSGGVTLSLRLSHGVLAELVAARRPSVSLALKELERAGLVARLKDSRWRLIGTPPEGIGRPAAGELAPA